MKIPTTLIIMDGYGLAPASPGNAVSAANTPILDKLFTEYPNTTLSASGEDVGLPAGQIGNSEVGHTNIGAGRIVYQDLSRITNDIKSGDFFKNPAFCAAMENCKQNNTALHLMGLVSPGGVHSHTEHLYALLKLAKSYQLENVYIHCFTDGRDTPPRSAAEYISETAQQCTEIGVGKIATIIGRFYAMDRDSRWERLETAYNALVRGIGTYDLDPVHAVNDSYENDVADEFIKPVICDSNGLIKSGDSIIFFNFRPDRAREITRAFVDPEFDAFPLENGKYHFVCATQYDAEMPNITVAYPPESLEHTLGDTISRLGLTQLRIAETEKYAHVTFFFNGGVEQVFPGEERVLIPSPKEFPTYDLIPEMSAYKLTEEVCHRIESRKYDVIVLNFANCDMVGHTGNFKATVKAVEVVDECVGKVLEKTANVGGIAIVTADHGNAEEMLELDGITPHTAHSTNLVPFILVGTDVKLHPGRLSDIAPTLLELMGLEKPADMTGNSLIDMG